MPAALALAPVTGMVVPPLSTEEAEKARALAPKYRFDVPFQTKIAALVCRDGKFAQQTDGLISPDYFENMSEAILVAMAVDYFKAYKKLPGDITIFGALIREAVINKTLKKETAAIAAQHLKSVLFQNDISDGDFVVEQAAKFARHQAVAQAMMECTGELDKKNFDKIETLMKTALDVGAHQDYSAYDFGDNVDARLGDRLDRIAGKLPPQGVTTGYAPLDEHLYHKGWGRRELSVIMGGAKAGKTTGLLDFAINAVAAGFDVLYVTLEVSAKILAERADSNISEVNIGDLGANAHDVRSKVKSFIERATAKKDAKGGLLVPGKTGNGARFVIQEFPTGSMRTSDLRRLLERYKARGVKFDMVVMDYADLMAPERYTDSVVENSKSVYVNLRGLAMHEDIAVLTATQTNRTGAQAAVARAEHVSEDFNKIRIADIVISINRSEEERAVNQARLFFAACRNQAGGFSIRIEQALARMKFITKVVGVE